jgi:acetate CoA/acetoacetate CoA-transferase alpha subunit
MMTNKLASKEEIMSKFFDGMTLMVGGFACSGVPRELIELVLESGVKDITLISNDAGDPDVCQGRLYHAGLVKECWHSHVGLNPEFGELAKEGKFKLHITPQGTLVEKIRCGGVGAGGILLRAGMGTGCDFTKERETITVDGKEWFVETPLRADVALIRARRADIFGNLTYRGNMDNYNSTMAMAADCTIVQADHICDIEEIPMDTVRTPGVFVNMILDEQRRYI